MQHGRSKKYQRCQMHELGCERLGGLKLTRSSTDAHWMLFEVVQ